VKFWKSGAIMRAVSNRHLRLHLIMRKVLPCLLITLFSVTIVAQTRYVTVTSQKANLRGSPSTSAAIIDEVKLGETFRLIEERGRWYLVETLNYVGWLNASTVKVGSRKPDVIDLRDI